MALKKSYKDIAYSPTRSFYGGSRRNPDFNKILIRYGIPVFVCKFAHAIFLTTISLDSAYLWKNAKK
jgi:hypothetical protein